MKFNKHITYGVVLLSLCANLYAASWEDEKKNWEETANAPKYKDPGYAAKLAMNPLPMALGQFYVNDVGKGIWFTVGQTFSLAALAVAIFDSRSNADLNKEVIWSDQDIALTAIGGLGYIVLKVWSAYDAADSARAYNKINEEKHSLNLQFAPRTVQLAYQYKF